MRHVFACGVAVEQRTGRPERSVKRRQGHRTTGDALRTFSVQTRLLAARYKSFDVNTAGGDFGCDQRGDGDVRGPNR